MLITLKRNIVDPMFLLPKCVSRLYISFEISGLKILTSRPRPPKFFIVLNKMYSSKTHFGNKNIGFTMFRFKVISIYNNKNRSRPRCIYNLKLGRFFYSAKKGLFLYKINETFRTLFLLPNLVAEPAQLLNFCRKVYEFTCLAKRFIAFFTFIWF